LIKHSLRFLLTLGPVVASAIAISSYLMVAVRRAGYPFALEWVEANSYLHVLRVLACKPIYAPPSFEFVSMIYPPLYYAAAAPLAWATGQIMPAMRLISLAASLAAFIAIYLLARGRGLSRAWSFVAVGLFAASYRVVGYWFDVARVDMLFLALLLLAAAAAVAPSRRDGLTGVVAGLLLALAFSAKQQALLLLPFLLLYLALERRWRKALAMAAAAGVVALGFVIAANLVSGGWFWFYTVRVPAAAPTSPRLAWELTRQATGASVLPALALTAIGVLVGWRTDRNRVQRVRLATLGVLLLALFAASYLSMSKQWGYVNGLLPAAAGLALAAAEASWMIDRARLSRPSMQMTLLALAAGLLLLQFVLLRYNPAAQLPSQRDLQAGYATLDALRTAPDPVFAPTAPYLLHMAGRPTHFHLSALSDVEVAAAHDPTIAVVFQPHHWAILEATASSRVRSAVLPDVDWLDAAYGPAQGFTCVALGIEGRTLGVFTGAPRSVDRLCIRP
jgi:4-amino-4-deoxy-L-arabinose transferase-like glycosyltransferase